MYKLPQPALVVAVVLAVPVVLTAIVLVVIP
jgi:hypothetical protein